MRTTMKAHVVKLLETYQVRAEQIDLLHFELSHPARVSADEMIEAMSLARGEDTGSSGGHISDKTLYIALNYQEQTDGANDDASADIVERLVTLERVQAKLTCLAAGNPSSADHPVFYYETAAHGAGRAGHGPLGENHPQVEK